VLWQDWFTFAGQKRFQECITARFQTTCLSTLILSLELLLMRMLLLLLLLMPGSPAAVCSEAAAVALVLSEPHLEQRARHLVG